MRPLVPPKGSAHMFEILALVVLALPTVAIGIVGYQALTSWHTPKQTAWALALLGLSAAYAVLLWGISLIASIGLITSIFLVNNSTGTQKTLRPLITGVSYGAAISAGVALLALVLCIYTLLSAAWRKARTGQQRH